jgi:glycosyltransferase involved in cell wall biosynthesis
MLDVRETSHMSAGMLAYVRVLSMELPEVAADLRIGRFGFGDNFDAAEQIGMPLLVARWRPRLVHLPTPFVPRFIPAPYVVTVHDVIDLEFPEYAKRKVGPYWRHVVGPVLRGARAVITDDEMTIPLLERYLRVDPARVRVIPLGVDTPGYRITPERRARPYFFYAGNHRPHKDLGTLVSAWASLPERVHTDLVMTGDEDSALRALSENARGELVFTGDCDFDRLDELFRGALAYVQPSLREGFGLPVLEALRAGTPAIGSETAVPAVLRGYVHLYPPRDVDALRALLVRAFDEREAFAELAGRAQAATAHLTWERMVRATADLYRELLGARAAPDV